MRRKLPIVLAISLLAGAVVPAPSEAHVVRFVVEETRSFAGGMSFGTTGPYERLDGTVYMEVDPNDPLHAVLVNLDKAPRNARGMVEYSAPFFILKPTDMRRGNGKIFYVVNNRGNKQALAYFNFAPASNNPLTAADAGDGFLMRLGYTIVDAGWQGNVAARNDRLVPKLPVAKETDGRPIVAQVRVEYADATGFTLPLEGSPAFRAYVTDDTDTAHSTLTVRSTVGGARVPVAPGRWAFGRCPTGSASLVQTTTDICLFEGFQVDRIYELIYPAKDPLVMGLGYAVTRDIGSFLRYQTRDEVGNVNPLATSPTTVGIRRSYTFGGSSTGMYMRDFIYLGFNEDESHRKVFDGLWIHKPGTHRLFANVEFSDPNTYSREDRWHDSLSRSHPPLTHAVTTDPISGIRDGLLRRPTTDPVVFQSDTSNEFWQMQASLYLTTGLGEPVQIPEKVRLYLLSSFQHSGNSPPQTFPGQRGRCLNPTNPIYHGPTLRALLMALDAWADRGGKPPNSAVPDVRNGTLVSLAEARKAFPAIPGVEFPPVLNELQLSNFGPGFDSKGGRRSLLPPRQGSSYRVLVPKTDQDGLDIAGIRPIEIRAPLGTNTPWNMRAPEFRSGSLCALSGSYIPFARTKAERLAEGDPRRSLEERYTDHEGYVKAVKQAAKELIDEGFLLEQDAERFIAAADTSDVLR